MQIEYEYKMTLAERLAGFAEQYGSLEKLRKRVKKTKRVTKPFADLEEWEHYLTPHEHQHKPDEEIRISEKVIFHDPASFFQTVTAQRVRLLNELRKGKDYQSLRELAAGLGRDPKNVYEDLKALEKVRLVEVERRNRRRSIPRARVNEVLIRI